MECAMAAKRGERRDADSAYDALTLKQRRFVDEYLVDLNATQAAIRAEYSERNADKIGPELLGKTRVAEAIQERMAARAKRTEITQDMVLRELAKIGFSDIRRAIKWDTLGARIDEEDGEASISNSVELLDSDDLDDDTAAAIQEISQTAQGIRLKLYDKKGALVDIGRHLGMFDDKLTLRGDKNAPVVVEHAVTDYAALRATLKVDKA